MKSGVISLPGLRLEELYPETTCKESQVLEKGSMAKGQNNTRHGKLSACPVSLLQ